MYHRFTTRIISCLLSQDNQNPQTRENRKENVDQDSGITTLLADFASTTTAHGVGRIAASSDYRFKFSWLAVWFGVMISFTWMVVKLAILYTSRPVSTGIGVSYEEVRGPTGCDPKRIYS